MKRSGIGFGIFLMFVGIIALLIYFDVLNISILFFLATHLPLIIAMLLILSGINLIFRNYYFIKFITWTVFFAVLISLSYFYQEDAKSINYDYNKPFTIESSDETVNGELRLDFGGLKLKVDSTENNLIEGIVRDPNIKYEVDYKNGKKTAFVKFNNTTVFSIKNLERFFNIRRNVMEKESNIFLNENVLWDIDMNMGAIDTEIDMSRLKVKNLDIDGGAGNFKIVLGEKYSTKVKVDAGAAEFDIHVPKTSGLRLKVDGWLNSTNFNNIDLEKQGDYYKTSNYDEAENKIEIDVDIGAGDLEINGIE
ncbi:MAG: hypothetical protein ACOYWZ_23185 [Bacillota bacterium]